MRVGRSHQIVPSTKVGIRFPNREFAHMVACSILENTSDVFERSIAFWSSNVIARCYTTHYRSDSLFVAIRKLLFQPGHVVAEAVTVNFSLKVVLLFLGTDDEQRIGVV
jgi:hypothetical protein